MNRREFLKTLAVSSLLGLNINRVMDDFNFADAGLSFPNVIVLVFDALSAKNMPLYGYPRNTTPNINNFAEKSTIYHNHYAAGSFTSSGTSSIFTGTYPWTHRALHLKGSISKELVNNNFFNLIPQDVYKETYTHNLLAYSLLSQFQGRIDRLMKPRELALFDPHYSDLKFPSDYNLSFLSETSILDPDGNLKVTSPLLSLFNDARIYNHVTKITQKYGKEFPRGLPKVGNLHFLMEDFVNWLKDEMLILPQPFMLYLHLIPPHSPYNARRDFTGVFDDDFIPPAKPVHYFTDGLSNDRLNQLRREYDEYIAYADAEFGRLDNFLQKKGFHENTYIIFTTDHGEMFERGIEGHVNVTLYEPHIRIPLIIHNPGQTFRENIYQLTNSVDLLPTILQIYDQTIPAWCEGQILPPFPDSVAQSDRHIFVVEAKSNSKFKPITKGTLALRKGDYKLIRYMGYEGYEEKYEFYNLSQDPEELNDLYSLNNPIVKDMVEELSAALHEANLPYL